jgi:uncharacterized protein (TIGR02001 family)
MRCARFRVILVAGASLLGVDALAGAAARAQEGVGEGVGTGTGGVANIPVNLGGRPWSMPGAARSPTLRERLGDIELSFRAGLASDYIYRGTTLSDRGPAVGAGFEAVLRQFYVGGTIASVKLPTQPSAELTVAGGVRPKLGPVEFDFGATYFFYPGEMAGSPTGGIEYWEAAARAEAPLGERVRVGALYAHSPNVSNTGAWGHYAAAGAGFDGSTPRLPALAITISGGAGYSWFGSQYDLLGGFPLPNYLNWQAGVTFTYKQINLDLRYHDTNLSKEDCYVFTGDPNAQPGGRVNPITNPDGLTSRWCGAAFVGRLWFELTN